MISALTIGLATWLALSAAPARAESRLEIQSSKIAGIQSADLPPKELQELSAILGVETGHTLDRRKLDEGLKRAHSSGEWRRLLVEALPKGKGALVLKVTGAKVRRLRELRFRGISDDILVEVKRAASDRQDNSADPRAFSLLTDSIRTAFDERGYPAADIGLEVIPVNDKEADVEISVRPGAPVKVESLKVTGGSEGENRALADEVGFSKGDNFSKLRLDEGIEKINKYLRDNQYPTSKVMDVSVTQDAQNRFVKIEIKVNLGQKLQFQFTGNQVFEDITLRALLTPEVLSLSDPTPRITELIVEKYRNVGYHFCKVTPVVQEARDSRIKTVELKVEEGSRVLIEDLMFSGGEVDAPFNVRKLFFELSPGVMQRRLFWEKGLATAVENLRKALRERGYLNARISDPKIVFNPGNDGVVLYFDFDLGVRTFVGAIQFDGVTAFTKDELGDEVVLQPGEPLNESDLEKSREAILRKYSSRGYIDTQFNDETGLLYSGDKKLATVRFSISEGARYRVGTISVEGLRKTKSKVVLREVLLKPGDDYDPLKVSQSEEAIAGLGLFQRVQIQSSSESERSAEKDLKILLAETLPGLGELGVGAMYEEPRLRARTFAGLQYRNLQGLNQTLSGRGEFAIPFSSRQQFIPFFEYSGSIGYRYPYPLDVPITFSSSFSLDRFETNPDTQTLVNRARIEGRLEKALTKNVTVFYRLLRLERSTTELLLPPIGSNSTPVTESIGSTGPGLIVDFRDDVFNPRRGSYHSLDLELALPEIFSQADIGFVMLLNRNSFYVPIFNPVGLTMSFGLGYAHSLLALQPLPDVRLVNELAIGGQGSVRGHAPRSIFGSSGTRNVFFYNARSEFLIPLFADFGLATFYDMGQLFPDYQSTEMTHGVGVGFRYKTPVGPVSVDFAKGFGNFGKSADRTVRFYFTVGTI
jgi:outer membrane protein insertion porin family